MPVSPSMSGASVLRVRSAGSPFDFQMMRGSSPPTSVQFCPGTGGAAGEVSACAADGKSGAVQLFGSVQSPGVSGATRPDSSTFVRSTTSTRPAPSVIVASCAPGTIPTEYAPDGTQTTSTSELLLRSVAGSSLK